MTARNFEVELDDAIYQAALERAQSEDKTIETVLYEFINSYAGGKPQPVITTYRVKRGDTLSRIARQVYGDARQYPVIQQANNLSDPGRIWIGQVLVIPTPAGSTPEAAPSPAVPAAPAPAAPLEPPPLPSGPELPPPPLPPETVPEPTEAPEPVPPAPASTEVDPCAPITGEEYGTLPIVGSPTDRPAAEHGDINLALRGCRPSPRWA
jgi:hypothetical protein